WDVKDGTPWVNGASEIEMIYLHGDTVDFQLATDPSAAAGRNDAVAGDLRLSIGNFKGKPTAVLYRKVSGEKHPKEFSSGVIKSYVMESVTVVEGAKIEVKKGAKGYVVEAAIPLAVLGLKPADGLKLKGDFGVTHGGPAWGSACVIVPWALYCFYGDRRVLEDHYGMMTGWLRYLGTRTDDGAVVVREEPGSWCLGDWCVPTRAGEETGPPPELVNTYVHARVARLMTRVARVLGRTDDAAVFEDLADRVSAAFHARFRDPETGDYASGKHGANAFGLAMDPPSKEERQRTLDRLMERLRVANQGHLDTGIVGTPVLLDLLVACGREDAAWEIVTKTTFPSYGYMLERGATTLWESWSGDGSHCHPMFGSVSGWLFRHLAGIQPDPAGPGFERIVIRPVMPRGLASAAASVRTLRGTVAVDWKKGDGPLRLEVAIPGNSTARVYVPTLGAKAVRITEGGRPVWEGCACCPGVPGIAGAEATPGGVVVTVDGGTYRFEVAGSG
ncbi:MAG: alpha-L-rhamnosidase C-terminal domain-containing protein, partial [Phycisphaerae bacterium]